MFLLLFIFTASVTQEKEDLHQTLYVSEEKLAAQHEEILKLLSRIENLEKIQDESATKYQKSLDEANNSKFYCCYLNKSIR